MSPEAHSGGRPSSVRALVLPGKDQPIAPDSLCLRIVAGFQAALDGAYPSYLFLQFVMDP